MRDIIHGIIKKIANKNPNIYRVEHRGASFLVSFSNEMELWRAKSFSLKEPETVEWIERELTSESIFWDVGGNIGLFSLFAAKKNKNIKVYTFEPESQNFASLCRNIWLNNLANIESFPIGVSGIINSNNFNKLHISKMEAGSAVHNIGEISPWNMSEVVFKQDCYCVSIDDLINKYGFYSPTILKIDVDGIELDILNGAEWAIANTVKTLLVEMDANNLAEIKIMEEFMIGNGFKLYQTSNRTKYIGKKQPKNYIWNRV